ncbi:unnamed protein product [Prunus armeniaca]|uniref:Uncharacterized protein n=1 Tax=Prunus armeniaca TaxID=36596 RepID=A0A6J5UGS5_PRUAR|nr:unnamed protein product [Prunus armeniaca]
MENQGKEPTLQELINIELQWRSIWPALITLRTLFCHTLEEDCFELMVANETKLTCTRRMVLGARWFRNLGSCLWDFSSFMMESSINGQRCIVYGKMKEPNG